MIESRRGIIRCVIFQFILNRSLRFRITLGIHFVVHADTSESNWISWSHLNFFHVTITSWIRHANIYKHRKQTANCECVRRTTMNNMLFIFNSLLLISVDVTALIPFINAFPQSFDVWRSEICTKSGIIFIAYLNVTTKVVR